MSIAFEIALQSMRGEATFKKVGDEYRAHGAYLTGDTTIDDIIEHSSMIATPAQAHLIVTAIAGALMHDHEDEYRMCWHCLRNAVPAPTLDGSALEAKEIAEAIFKYICDHGKRGKTRFEQKANHLLHIVMRRMIDLAVAGGVSRIMVMVPERRPGEPM